MNYLAHLHLGGNQPHELLGSLYGDFVKGRLQGHFPVGVEEAIRLHRRIDAFTDQHPFVEAARARFPSERRRTSGILLDLFFDHCLALHWPRYADEPLDAFTARVYRVLVREPALPGRLASVAPYMVEHDWLGSYRDFDVLGQVLRGMGRRLSKPQMLDGALQELERLYQPLTEDFHQFYPQLQAFVAQESGRVGTPR